MSHRGVSANGSHGIPEATIARLPVYLRALYALAESGTATVSSEELAVAAGVTSILNFAPVVLNVPDEVDVRKVDLSIELQILAFHAQRRSDVRVTSVGKSHYRAGVGVAALAGSPGESVTAP